jgi:hypothetical protein
MDLLPLRFCGEEESTSEGHLQRGWESSTPFISQQMSQPGSEYDISTPAMITDDYPSDREEDHRPQIDTASCKVLKEHP